jgi:ankyrin repeat protein
MRKKLAFSDVNAKTKDGKTALTQAIEKGRTEVVEMLKKTGAQE